MTDQSVNAICKRILFFRLENSKNFIYQKGDNKLLNVTAANFEDDIQLKINLKESEISKIADKYFCFRFSLKQVETGEVYQFRTRMAAVEGKYSIRASERLFYRNLNNPYSTGVEENSDDMIVEPTFGQIGTSSRALSLPQNQIPDDSLLIQKFSDLSIEEKFFATRRTNKVYTDVEVIGFDAKGTNAIVVDKKIIVQLSFKHDYKISVVCDKVFNVVFKNHVHPVRFKVILYKKDHGKKYGNKIFNFRINILHPSSGNKYHLIYKLTPSCTSYYNAAENIRFFRYLNNPYHEPIMSTEEENQIIESTISAFAPMNEQTRRVEVAELSDDETGFIDGIEENAATPSVETIVDGTWSYPTTGLFGGASYAHLQSSEGKENALWPVNRSLEGTVVQADEARKVPEVDQDLVLSTETLLSADS